MIPSKYTCDGQDISPPLDWGEPPQQTQAFALIMDDPDAPGGIFTHWILFNLPADIHRLGEDIHAQEQLQNGALQGKNDFGRTGYSGPCPPRGPSPPISRHALCPGQGIKYKPCRIQETGFRCYAWAHPCSGATYRYLPALA